MPGFNSGLAKVAVSFSASSLVLKIATFAKLKTVKTSYFLKKQPYLFPQSTKKVNVT
jgi:hypothetical protein